MSERPTCRVFRLVLISAFGVGATVGVAQTTLPSEGAASGEHSKPAQDKPYAMVTAYLDIAAKDVELSEILAEYGGSRDDDGDNAFTDSSQEEFRAAYLAARDQPDLAAALKSVRAAQIAVWTDYSRAAGASLNKAIADANVELELVAVDRGTANSRDGGD